MTTATTHAAGVVGQETYLTDEFPTLTAGYRITVDLTSATFSGSQAAQTIALAVASTATPTSRTNILFWGWRTNTMVATSFNASGGTTTSLPAYPGAVRPDSVFIERTATGWNLGSIKNGVETLSFTNITAVGATSITATASAPLERVFLRAEVKQD